MLNLTFEGPQVTPVVLGPFQEVSTGTYTSIYRAFDVTPVTITAYFGTIPLPGFPLKAYMHSYGYFPHPMDDVVWTWEGTPVTIDALANDYFGLRPGYIHAVVKQPIYGVAILRGGFLVYIPLRGFIGKDTFTYRVRDPAKHSDTALVTVDVVKHPPQIISTPGNFNACEGRTMFLKNGNLSFMIDYSSALPPEAFAQISTKHGQVQTAADFHNSWLPSDVSTSFPALSKLQSSSNASRIDLVGSSDSLNSALSSLIFLGAPNFHGKDTITLKVMDEGGDGDEESIVIEVLHINSPPYITSFPFILVNGSGDLLTGINETGALMMNQSAIKVGDFDVDPDINSDMQVEITLQIGNGTLIIQLPENSTESTEFKQEDDYHWIPIPTAIIQNGFFTVQGKGIKFRASMQESNTALNSIKYNGSVNGAVITVTVNDLGYQGGDSACSSDGIYPLSTQMDMTLVFEKPIPSQHMHDYWKKVVVRTKALVILAGTMALGFMIMILSLYLLLPCLRKNSLLLVKDTLYKESDLDDSRVYNPMWIPQAPSLPTLKFLNTSNPYHFQLQKQALRQGLSNASKDMESIMSFHVKKQLASFKTFKGLSFKLRSFRRHEEEYGLLSEME